MKPVYKKWIKEYEAREGDLKGKCAAAVFEMRAYFPELEHAEGTVQVWFGEDHHHWCVDPENGEIVDPTRNQYGARVIYEEEKNYGPRLDQAS